MSRGRSFFDNMDFAMKAMKSLAMSSAAIHKRGLDQQQSPQEQFSREYSKVPKNYVNNQIRYGGNITR